MEPEEIQNITLDRRLIANGAGIDLGSEEESETTATSHFIDDGQTISETFENEIEKQVATKSLAPRTTAFAKVEKSLASLGFFTPSSRRIKNQKVKRVGFAREIDGKRVEVSAEIHPSAMFGLPVTADQDKYLALQKIITNTLQSEGKVSNPIRFKSAELLRLLNTSTKTGKNYKAISEWLDVMSATTIISHGAVYVAGQKKFARDRFRVFDRALSFGKEMDDGTVADANYVWLSAWQLENINNKFLMPIDLETYRELKNHIAKALVPLLQIWLFASHKAEAFEKRYSELRRISCASSNRHWMN
jgi:Replication initiator protein A